MAPIIVPCIAGLDLPRVLNIELASFTPPWTREMFAAAVDEIRGTLGCVARSVRGDVIGYGVCQIVAGEVDIPRVAVTQEWRRQGVGTRLLGWMMTKAGSKGARTVRLEVKESNLSAQRLYENAGFACIARRPDYYKNPTDAALVYMCHGLRAKSRLPRA